ncbi:hypothetical protein DFH07DRAFT_775296 [Mycena maculata]|uniref:Uncharacterized protein n=1 Tax=Mycena maculata TaxID=230809 RepID=A0AAD7IUP6_9AGAR|nr:hypothetical protein DFH07DRAFT_775296 [Mycena maculata]
MTHELPFLESRKQGSRPRGSAQLEKIRLEHFEVATTMLLTMSMIEEKTNIICNCLPGHLHNMSPCDRDPPMRTMYIQFGALCAILPLVLHQFLTNSEVWVLDLIPWFWPITLATQYTKMATFHLLDPPRASWPDLEWRNLATPIENHSAFMPSLDVNIMSTDRLNQIKSNLRKGDSNHPSSVPWTRKSMASKKNSIEIQAEKFKVANQALILVLFPKSDLRGPGAIPGVSASSTSDSASFSKWMWLCSEMIRDHAYSTVVSAVYSHPILCNEITTGGNCLDRSKYPLVDGERVRFLATAQRLSGHGAGAEKVCDADTYYDGDSFSPHV